MIRQKASFQGHTHCVYSVAFSPDGTYFASGSLDKTVRIWELQRSRQLYRFEEGTDSVRLVGWLDQERLYAGSFSPIIRIYRPFEGILAGIMHDSSNVIWLQADTKLNILYTLNQNGQLSMWCCKKLKKLLLYLHTQAPLTCFVLAQQHYLLYCCFNDKKIGQTNFNNEKSMVSYRAEHHEKINHMAYCSQTDVLALGDDEGFIIIYSVTRWEIVRRMPSQLGWIRAGCFMNKGEQYVAAGQNCQLLHINILTGRILTVLESHKNWVACLASSYQNQLLSCSQDNNIHYYERSTKK